MDNKEIGNKFSNRSNSYLGHGIGEYSKEKVESIFDNGLRCSHGQLSFTTISLGEGSENLFKENFELMNNWQHKDSKQIVIASIPTKFRLLDIIGTPLYGKQDAAFYNQISQEEARRLDISEGYYLKPEFIMGMYDADNNEFISNERYYENLKEEEQDKIFNEVKKQYIDILRESGFSFSEYSELLEEVNFENPLTQKEITQLEFIDNVLNQELLKCEVQIPGGRRVPARQYVQNMADFLIPESGKFLLKNGVTISAKQYIEEFVLGEGQIKYGGDIKKLFENTIFDDKKAIETMKNEVNVRALANVGTAAGIATGNSSSPIVGAVAGGKITTQTIGKVTINTPIQNKMKAKIAEEKVSERGDVEKDDN